MLYLVDAGKLLWCYETTPRAAAAAALLARGDAAPGSQPDELILVHESGTGDVSAFAAQEVR